MSPDFETFWRTYPRKVGKLAAEREWNRLRPSLPDVLAALAWQREQWDDPQFIPHPRTYLFQGRWMDEPQVPIMKADDKGHYPPCKTVTDCLAKAIADGRIEREAARADEEGAKSGEGQIASIHGRRQGSDRL